MAGLAARWADALEYRLIRPLRRHFRFIRGHRRHDRHRRHPADQAKRGYNEPLFLGTIAAGGTLGILIPPSINLILYGLLTNTSVPELYLAGFIPGFLLAALFIVTVVIACTLRPDWGGERLQLFLG